MDKLAKWIWLNADKYAEYRKSPVSQFDPYSGKCPFAVAEFQKVLKYEQEIKELRIDISADVKFWLYVNGAFVGQGPVGAGGDYGIDRPMPFQYYNTYRVYPGTDTVELLVMVQNVPTVLTDMSQGRNGMILSAEAELTDGTKREIVTDETWMARVNRQRYAVNKTDETVQPDLWTRAAVAENVWTLKKPDIRMLEEEEVVPSDFVPFTVEPGQMKELTCHFDKIYSVFHHIRVSGDTSYVIMVKDFERYEEKGSHISDLLVGNGDTDFRGLGMVSAGGFKVHVYNSGENPLQVERLSGYFTHYPVEKEGGFSCSEECLNKIYEMGRHALKICRQTLELDSPLHQENLGCAGDYFIASLMNYFTDGDTKLTRLDIVRIADCLKLYDGFMFHTTYSMIWIQMVYDYYLFSGDHSIFEEVSDAMEILLEKMHSYTEKEEIISNPPSYMFVDWLVVDGISLHHPPMALGQAVLNAFYYGGLVTAVKLFERMQKQELCSRYAQRAAVLKESFHRNFYDEQRGLYFDGHNTKHPTGPWLPENVDKRYFSWHTNSLAVLYDLAPAEEQVRIMETILNDLTLINPQPYFMHFVLEAVHKAGLFEKYGIAQLMRWKDMTKFEKGLQEGWYDMSGYGFDYSHVWGGTPTYQLPAKLSGFEMLEPGYQKIRLKPRLYGLEYAQIRMPTPYGYIEIKMKQGEKPQVSVPTQIACIIE